MYKRSKILALILARGGSKGIPKKNIKILKGKPLLAYTIEEAKNSKYIDRIILSTDDKYIANTGKKYGAEVPFIRPEKLATDEATSEDTMIHAIKWLQDNDNYNPKYTMLLQPTSPLRIKKDIDKSIELIINKGADSLVGLVKSDKHPYWMMEIKNGEVVPFDERKTEYNRRQELPPIYIINGAMYIVRTELLLKEKNLQPGYTVPYIMPKKRSVDIDDMMDWRFVEMLIEERRI